MAEAKEIMTPEIREQSETAVEREQLQPMEVVAEQAEMDALQPAEAFEAEHLEQQEMDAFSGDGKLGRMYDPPESPTRRYMVGEYRILCDTRPRGSRYDIFADGR